MSRHPLEIFLDRYRKPTLVDRVQLFHLEDSPPELPEGSNGTGQIDFTCPWEDGHTTGTDIRDSALQIENDKPVGFKCFHAGCSDRHLSDVYKFYRVKRAGIREVVATSASDIKPQRIKWLMEKRLPLGVIGLLAGIEGLGKSTYALFISARLTRGQLPGDFIGKPKGVAIVATEDSWAHTIVPRLIAGGADLTKIFPLIVKTAKGGRAELTIPDDLDSLRDVVREHDIALVILDPILSRLSPKTDTHRDSAVRANLEPLAKLADEENLTVLGIIHLNKSGNGGDLLSKIMGSRAFSAVVRSTLIVGEDPEDDTCRVLVHAKSNLGPKAPSIGFRISGASTGVFDDEGEIMAVRVIETGESDATAEDVIASDTIEKKSQVADAAVWLAEFLSERGGDAGSDEIHKAGKREGFGRQMIVRAGKRVRVFHRKGAYGRTTWELPGFSPKLTDSF